MARTVAIIGGGLAGVTAALFAARNGARPVIVKKGGGATSFSSGGLDLATDPLPPPHRPDKVETRSRANLARYVLNMPHHPYLKLIRQQEEEEVENILQMMEAARQEIFPQGAELELHGDVEFASPLFTSLGTVKYTNLFPEKTAGPESPGLQKPLVAGVSGLIDFDPWSFGRVAADNARTMGITISPRSAYVDFGETQMQSPALSSAIDRQPEAFLEAVSRLDMSGAESLLLPPVMPLARRASIMAELEERLSVPVYETLALPPSVPGLRLSEYLSALADKNQVPVLSANVTGFRTDDKRLIGLELDLSASAMKAASHTVERLEEGRAYLQADAVVLASGKFIGGGLAKERQFREKIFDLPVAVNNEFYGEVFIEKVLGHSVSDPHLIFNAGVLVDRDLRPLDETGTTVYENLFAAGAVLSGNDYMTQGTGAGVALASGLKAGENAAAGQ